MNSRAKGQIDLFEPPPSNVVPFGKYQGQPVEQLLADRDYCEWLLGQPWLAHRYADIRTIIVNYGAEPQDTPEHNQLQARLLDDDFCLAIANACRPGAYIGPVVNRQFEVHGWDVAFTVFKPTDPNHPYELNGTRFFIECKPTIGDDYPSVLRQIRSYRRTTNSSSTEPHPDGRTAYIKTAAVVLVSELTATSVSSDQVAQIFASVPSTRLVLVRAVEEARLTEPG